MYTLIGITIMVKFCLMQTGATPLYIASQEGHSDVVNLLISHGANVDKSLEVCHFNFAVSFQRLGCIQLCLYFVLIKCHVTI